MVEARKITGPLVIVVSVAQQKVAVFAADSEVATTRVSTGGPRHPTPLVPGTSLITSDNALSDETDSDTDFIVLTP